MKPRLLASLRSLEGLLLVGVLFEKVVSSGASQVYYRFFGLQLNLVVSLRADELVLSSIALGYFLSLACTCMWWSKEKVGVQVLSLVMASIGLASCLNEFMRSLFDYDFRIWIHLPLLLLVLDLLLLKTQKVVNIEEEEPHVSAS